MTPVDAPSELELADWRRRIAELYADIRRLAAIDPAGALTLWRQVRGALYREHDQSPVPVADRAAFEALHFAADPTLRFEVAVARDVGGPPADVPLSAGGGMSLRRLGWLDIPFAAGERRLALYWMEGYAGGLFLPFRDATNGRETYPAGRYLLDAAKGADLGATRDGRLVIDFNFAYQPSCAFDARWACPLAPPENWLDIPISAGERIA
ncbi:MAG TPA: DUF1684 domain-containing protein [Candidatus Limnocylindrales bacterium]